MRVAFIGDSRAPAFARGKEWGPVSFVDHKGGQKTADLVGYNWKDLPPFDVVVVFTFQCDITT